MPESLNIGYLDPLGNENSQRKHGFHPMARLPFTLTSITTIMTLQTLPHEWFMEVAHIAKFPPFRHATPRRCKNKMTRQLRQHWKYGSHLANRLAVSCLYVCRKSHGETSDSSESSVRFDPHNLAYAHACRLISAAEKHTACCSNLFDAGALLINMPTVPRQEKSLAR